MNKEILVEIIREASKLGRLISGKELEEAFKIKGF